tara:strand:+ start:248 stop:1111 length:864 start_codon:yes stop_codon:yes gene_type:complete
MITCFLKGGLGNQLFQIFAIIAYGLDNKFPFKFLKSDTAPSITPRHTYWNNFLMSLRFFTIPDIPPALSSIHHDFFFYKTIPLVDGKNSNIMIEGYFQSYKYFDHRKEDIFRLIQLEPQQKKLFNKCNLSSMENTISMHFRLGDYKHLSHTHPILGAEYYRNSLTKILSKNLPYKYKVFFACEKEDIDDVNNSINSLKTFFPSVEFEKISDDLTDWEQMLFMSLCHHNIIANSSFSYFSAYFNRNKDKIICYPNKWFNGEAVIHNDTRDMFPEEWHKVNSPIKMYHL